MQWRPVLLNLIAILLFVAGELSLLALAAGMVWGDVEASLYGSASDAQGLDLHCPIMLAPTETGTVSATVTNTLDTEVEPVVMAQISQGDQPQTLSETLTLDPGQSQLVQWPVDASDIVFGHLIVASVTQQRYSILDPHWGFCGILIFSLFNLPGLESLLLIMTGSLAFILAGGFLWARAQAPLDSLAGNTIRACAALAVMTLLAALVMLPRWWGLGMLLVALCVIMLGIILSEFVLFPKRER
jgi:hypothetical protein